MGGTLRIHKAATVAGLLALVLLASACSGTPVENGGDQQVGFDDTTQPDGVQEPAGEAATADPGSSEPGQEPGTDPAAPQGGDGQADGQGGAPGTGGGDGGGGGGTSPSGGGGSAVPEANLYSGADNTRGITGNSITLCGHAALVFAEAFDTRPEDLNLYWEVLNAAGGVHGRKVSMTWEDDAYSPDRAVQAAEACRSRNPAMLLGGIGFDQIPSVREWAEANKMLYLHHIAVRPNKGYRYSFTAQPTVQLTGRAFGDHIGARYASKKIGILWRQSENWEPGHAAGKAELARRGAKVVADLPVQANQGVYSQQIMELQRQGAEVVWLWENALVAAQVIQQAAAQRYRPKWVVFPFQTTLDVIGENAFEPTIDGVATWPAYAPGGYGGAFAQHGYDEEIKRFEAAYRKHRPNTKLNDILWMTWLANKFVHNVLDRCGRDCTRNRIAGVFESGLNVRVNPGCAVDFARQGAAGHFGGWEFTLLETFRKGDASAWRTNIWCSERLG